MLSEWRKIAQKKNVLLLAVILGINLFFLVLHTYGPGRTVSPQLYREIFHEMDGMSNQEKYEYLKERSEADIPDGTARDYEKRFLMEEMAVDAKTIACYEKYLSDIEESIGKKLGISLFGGKNSFVQRNAEKMQKAYRSLHGIPVRFESYKEIELADMTVTNILALFLVLFLSAESLIEEKEEGLLTLLRSCKKGRGWLLKNKICALILSIFLICGMFLLENLIFGRASYGGGSVGRAIQSLPGYEGCPWKISVLVFLLWIWILRTFGLMLASAFVLILTVGTYQMVRVLGECMLAGSVSYFLYMAIGLQSGPVILHYVNPAAYLAAAPLIKSEININLAGFPVNPLAAAVTVGIAVYIGLMLWLFRRFDKNRDERLPDVRLGIPGGKEAGIIRRSVEKRMKKKEYSVNVGMEEMYKLLIVKKSVLILSIILGVQIFLYPGRTYIAPPQEIYERYCMRQLKGELGEHQSQWLAQEQERLMEDRDSMQMEQEVMDGKILPLTEHLTSLKEKEGSARYIGQTGYEKLFGTGDRTSDRKNTMLYVLLLLCTVSPYITMEKTTNMIALIRPTKTGWNKVRNRKRWMVILFSAVSLVLLWLPDWIWILKTYPMNEWNAPVTWLYEFRDMRTTAAIGAYFILLLITRLLGGAAIGFLMCYISEKSRSGIEACGINTMIFFVPTVLAMLGVPYMEQFTFSALLDGNAILRMML